VGRGFALLDLSLLRQGIRIGWEFGIQSIAELARVGELVERSVYEPSSLATAPGGIRFTLLNPPLRMGAFSSRTWRSFRRAAFPPCSGRR
jgi:hypothetical protein